MPIVKKQFSAGVLKIGNSPFNITVFNSIQEEVAEDSAVGGKVQTNKKITKEIREHFMLLYFEEGSNFPRPKVVHNTSTHNDQENPRTVDQIERDLQTFVLVDANTQRIFFSDFRKKRTLESWLTEKLDKTVLIKNIIDKKDFLRDMQSVDKIYLSAVPSLFSNLGILGQELIRDHYNYGTNIKHIGVSICFEDNNVPAKLKAKIESFFQEKESGSIEKLEVTGRFDDKFERIFNAEGIVDKITIEVTLGEDGMLDRQQVFDKLISTITT